MDQCKVITKKIVRSLLVVGQFNTSRLGHILHTPNKRTKLFHVARSHEVGLPEVHGKDVVDGVDPGG